jgi:hypothetical protein
MTQDQLAALSDAELLPGPFCGEEARATDGKATAWVECINPNCDGSQQHMTMRAAIAAWNTRANQIAVIGPDAVERVETDFEQEGMVIWTKAEMAHSDAMKKPRTLPNKAAATVIAKALRSAALTGRV